MSQSMPAGGMPLMEYAGSLSGVTAMKGMTVELTCGSIRPRKLAAVSPTPCQANTTGQPAAGAVPEGILR